MKILFPISYFLIHISFICAVINLFIDIGMGYDIRFGIRSFQFLFNNPGPYAALMFVCYGILVICSNEKDKYIIDMLCGEYNPSDFIKSILYKMATGGVQGVSVSFGGYVNNVNVSNQIQSNTQNDDIGSIAEENIESEFDEFF